MAQQHSASTHADGAENLPSSSLAGLTPTQKPHTTLSNTQRFFPFCKSFRLLLSNRISYLRTLMLREF